jgi:isoleucyl-tRNA synthetase
MSRMSSSSAATFPALSPHLDLPALDREVLARWAERDVFARSLARTRECPPWIFYEGPPTANGMPGVHHVEARVFKDLFPRFKTMQGFGVPRRAGWDCHGLPVEIAVEQELGFSGKQDIEAYGVAQFNARCRESVLRHVDAFAELTERMGYWIDLRHPYRTMDASYVDSVWWSLKQIHDAGLLVEDFRITPYCPRCGTGLSGHEVAQGYQDVTDPSVYVRMPLRSGPLAGQADLLVWTTTPWTLVSNTAVATHPDVDYVLAHSNGGQRPVVVAEPLADRVLGAGAVIEQHYSGRDMQGWRYDPPFTIVDIPLAHYVVPADYVSTEEGTGLVHQAPAFGAEDMAVARAHGLPIVNPVRRDGTFEPDLDLVGGEFFKGADPLLVADLRRRGLLFAEQRYEHPYPHCWRCHTPLLYYALPSWFIRTTDVREQLLAQNESTDWHPASLKHGRYGEWLANNVDWALSRDRYWVTPLPIWRCSGGHLTCVGSRAELGELAGADCSALDPHRPYVDEVTLACPTCGNTSERVAQVIDAWYDSGSMPFAQLGYPHLPGSREQFEATDPADFICEGLDQTRGWFYTLMAVGTLVHERSPYRTVLCVGIILAADGRRMSKHLDNVLEPIALMDEHGADALRWFMAASGSPWGERRVGHEALAEVARKVLLTFWNTASFLVLYANAAANGPGGAAWTPARLDDAPAIADRPLLDRWALAELEATVREVTEALEVFDPVRAGRRLAGYVEDLSNWYVRRSRRRFWAGPRSADGAAAFATLYVCVHTLARLMAPITPFVTDAVWDVLRGADDPDSVHLSSWPKAEDARNDPGLCAQMALARRLAELGRAARASAKVPVRQPLRRALLGGPQAADLASGLRQVVAEELNVASVETVAAAGDLVSYSVKPNFRSLGRRLRSATPAVAAAIAAADPVTLAAAAAAGEAAVDIAGERVILEADDVIVSESPAEGWAVAADGGHTVALDLTMTVELRQAGLLREVIRFIQDARKRSGLDVSDRIELWWQTNGETTLGEALREGAASLATEVLAVHVSEGAPPDHLVEHADPDLGLTCWLRRA